MSFGWSFGDVVAGIKVVWDIYQAVADGPQNAQAEATQFFREFSEVIVRLEDWEKRKALCDKDEGLKNSHQQLKEQCTLFIKRHMGVIQHVNPNTKAIRQGRSTWLQRVAFTRGQVAALYQQVSWPWERKEVTKLRENLQFFLQLAAWDVAVDTNEMVRDFRTSHAELLSSNLKLVSSHLDLVSLITFNLKRVTHPLEPGLQAQEIDYPMLRQFDQALRPPQPLRAIEAAPNTAALPWRPRSRHEEAEYAAVSPAAPYDQDAGPFDQNEIRGLISRRLDNMSMRVRRVETMETISESASRGSTHLTIHPLLQRLKDMRDQIGNAVGVVDPPPTPDVVAPVVIIEPESALREELEAWNQLEERIEREILHPGKLLTNPESSTRSKPIPIPPRKHSTSMPQGLSYEGWHGPTSGLGSPDSHRGGGSPSSPSPSRYISRQRTYSSSSSISPPQSVRLEHYLEVQICYTSHSVEAVIHSMARSDDGEVQAIAATTQDGATEIRHAVDMKAPALTETSMKPFLDNCHVDKTHKYRVQFQGAHNLKVTRFEKVSRYPSPPTYTFHNQNDFLEFQSLLLNKEVVFCADVHHIKSSPDKDIQCRLGTIRILFDPFFKTRHILYFRHTLDQKHGFVEWPVSIFKDLDPKKKPPPGTNTKSKTITLESIDGKSLSLSNSKNLSRRSTQGSLATINSFESTSGPAFARMQERSNAGKGIKGLIVEFYGFGDCLKFWNEFSLKEGILSGFESGAGAQTENQGLGLTLDIATG